MSEAPTDRNRLDEAESPYLRQHADNPVNWQPWDERAREAARERDVPIFLSIGYAACHWCHVMEEESFEDEAVAELLNEHFVPVKVDREERPDVDAVYMSICQQVTGRGGWPLSAWLTPDGEPFYVGTYFPKEPRRGTPGFVQLLRDIVDSWQDPEERESVEARAAEWTRAIESDLADTPEQPGDAPDESALERAADAAVRGADREHGGWASGPKFPQPGRLHVLLRAHALAVERADDPGADGPDGATTPYLEVARETLDAMVDGGLYDQLGGGFHRYCTDREWVVPHFEKMCYDNAEIPRALLAGYQLTGRERYRTVVEETTDFLDRELSHPEGGFYSTLDARSEGEEGTFYVWTPVDIREILEDERAADLFCGRYGVTPGGNFEGTTVLTIATAIDALAEEYDMAPAAVESTLSEARDRLFAARAERERPARDEKVLAGWNGLAIGMLADAAIVLDGAYADRAAEALTFVRERLWEESAGRLARRFKGGDVAVDGYLEDYAFLARGSLALFEATGERSHLAFALDLARTIEAEFWDAGEGTLYFTPESGEDLVARPQELTDQSTPSSAGVAADVLLALSKFVPHDRFESIAEGVLATHGNRIEARPQEHASLVLAADRYARGSLELTLAADEVPADWRGTLADTYVPARLLAWRPESEDRLGEWLGALDLSEAPPIWADREAKEDEPTVYACRNFACSPPSGDLEEALDWARRNA